MNRSPRSRSLFLQSEPVAFEHAEDLFDAPAQAEADNLPGVLGRLDWQHGQKPPQQRLGPGGSADFARHDDADLARLGIGAGAPGLGFGNRHLAERHRHTGDPAAVARRARLAWGDRHIDFERRRETVGRLEQEAAVEKLAVAARPRDEIDVLRPGVKPW